MPIHNPYKAIFGFLNQPLKSIRPLALLLLTSCHSFGPNSLQGVHPQYNDAINASVNEQFIQNLVRLHYYDPTFFLDVTNVAATFKLDFLGGLVRSTADPITFTATGEYYSQPTITFTPLQGEAFVKSLLSPINLRSILELTTSGWSARRTFGLCVERINDLENAPTASGPMPDKPPPHNSDFLRFLELVDNVRPDSLINLKGDDSNTHFMLEIRSNPEHELEILEIKRLLGLDPKRDTFPIQENLPKRDPGSISVSTRSLMSIMFYLSHNIDTPKEHVDEGWVKLPKQNNGTVYNWGDTPAGQIFHIRVSSHRPDDSFLAIPYYDYWFYIPQSDLQSKSTFMLLTQLFRLQAGSAKSVTPALTIPVR